MASEILVTSANGNIGSQLVKMFSENDMPVRALVRPGGSLQLSGLRGVEVIEADMAKPASLAFAYAGCSRVCLILPLVSNMIDLAATALAAAKRAGVEHIVKMSGMFSAQHKTKIGEMHRATEEEIEKSGIPFTFLRPNSFFQNYVNFCAATIKQHQIFYLPLGDTRISLVDARDVAAVAFKILTTSTEPGGAYDVTGPESLTNEAVADVFTRVIGKRVSYAPVTDDVATNAMAQSGMPYWLTTALIELYQSQRTGDAELVSDTVSHFTGREPIRFEQFVHDYKQSFCLPGT